MDPALCVDSDSRGGASWSQLCVLIETLEEGLAGSRTVCG